MTARVHRWGLVVSLALVGVAMSPAATAAPKKKKQVLQDKEARAHFERAQGHFESEDYEAAIPELKAAYALEPNPMLLYAWAQAERLAGSCARAVGLYRRYLETEPATEQRQLAEANLLDCEAELPPPPEPEPEPEIDPLPPDDTVDDPPSTDEPTRPWHRDPTGGVLFGVGLAGAAAGGTLMGVARSQGAQAPDADVEDDYLATRARAERMNIAGIVTLGVGSALLLGGVIRYAVVASKARRRSDTAFRWAPTWTGAGVGVGLKGTF